MIFNANRLRGKGHCGRSLARYSMPLLTVLSMAGVVPAVVFGQNAAVNKQPAASEMQDPAKALEKKSVADLPELSDREVMLAVEDELRRSEAVNGHLIDVDVADGIATLSGKLNNILAEQIAVDLAERVRGVKSVVDEIAIVAERRDDAVLTKDVLAAVKADPGTRDLKLTVKVADGTVTLTGKVPSYGLKTLAEEVTMGAKGVVEVENNLQVEAAAKLTDDQLQKEIRELYRFSASLDDVQLQVAVKDGNVVLNGNVAGSFQKSYAEDLAWQAGAKAVDSRGIDVNWRHTNPLLRQQRYTAATDKEITEAVQRAFQHDPRVLSFKPAIQVDHGVVTLTGEVSHITAQKAAERDALQTIGVRRVKNNLRVRWPDKSLSDDAIADFTRQALSRDPYVQKHNIVVECGNAHVSLYGMVDTPFEKEHAVWTASCQQGVVHINDYLAVRKNWVPKSDAAIQADLDDKLAYAFVDPDSQVTAKVVDGVAILQGTVDTWMMWQTAMDQAIAAGARRPHNLIVVRYGLPSGPHYYGPHDYVPR